MSSTTGTDDAGPPGHVLWRAPEEPSRGPRRALTLDEVAWAAVGVADRDGLAGLSMQRVAAEVGLTKMALYRYVANKEELEALMIDAAVEEPPGPDALTGTWREQAVQLARMVSDVWTRHPWIPWITVGERVMGPREVGWVEAAVRVVEPLGLAPDERMDAVTMLFGHLRTTLAAATAGTRPWTADPEGGSTMRDLVAAHADRYPALTAVMADPGGPVGSRWDFGLQCLLDGFAAAAERRSR
ncbi:TetR/AcrR family transcriptional regulator [Actinomycetospora lutea]|uniref:TetR/AcrR family transcriptional regulator n=1 Tax=Actinomycetospora lutea TaxID=663604 RepID=UPI0023656E0E|nr:TetR/AcrR family transcriptional regulator [Actinomycetospora lutea]MDD7937254.1 TetR/AcrR family transcriptional regulator [Actinomycetospora lutea]